MPLRVIYRSYGGENTKDRPEGFSKLLCLASFLRAAEAAGSPEVVFLNDGPVPEDRLRLMRAAGRVVELPSVGMRASYWGALRTAAASPWDDEDVVWFSEDDYLYRADAFTALVEALPQLPGADYVALYGSSQEVSVHGPDEPDHARPGGWVDVGPVEVGGRSWTRIYSTASTFGGRLGALRQDLRIFRLCMVPHRTMYRDHDTCLVLQGARPYSVKDLLLPVVSPSAGPVRDRLRSAAMAPFYAATSLRALRRPSRRRRLMAPVPNLIAHAEQHRLPPETDWAAVMADVRAWCDGRGVALAR